MKVHDERSDMARHLDRMAEAETSFTALIAQCLGDSRVFNGSSTALDAALAKIALCENGCMRVVRDGPTCLVCTLNAVERGEA